MHIQKEQVEELVAEISISISPEDYTEKVSNALKDYAKKASMPGFRPGKVPMGLIKKMYEKTLIGEEVNKLSIQELYNFIDKEQLKVLGYPLPVAEKTKSENLDTQPSFIFVFEIGLEPQIDIELNDKIAVDYYDIEMEEKSIDHYMEDFRHKYGKMVTPDTIEPGDMIFTEITQLDENKIPVENGINDEIFLHIKYFTDEVQQKFIGLKKNDELEVEIPSSFKEGMDLKLILQITEKQAKDLKAPFLLKIKDIHRVIPAEINEDFCKKVSGNDKITTESALREFFRSEEKKYSDKESDNMFYHDALHAIYNKYPFQLPDSFIKRWLVHSSSDQKEPLTMEQVEKDYEHYAESLRFQLIEKNIEKLGNIKVEPEEIKEYVKDSLWKNMAAYGYGNPTEEMLENTAEKMMKDSEYLKNYIIPSLYQIKYKEYLKSVLKINKQTITYENFVTLAEAKKHHH